MALEMHNFVKLPTAYIARDSSARCEVLEVLLLGTLRHIIFSQTESVSCPQ